MNVSVGVHLHCDSRPSSLLANSALSLTGLNLETIEKMGWDDNGGLDISASPLLFPGRAQTIDRHRSTGPVVARHDASCLAAGDAKGRSTIVKAPALPLGVQATPKAATTTSLKVSINPSTGGQAVTFAATVTVSGGGPAAGAVTFLAGNTALGTGTRDRAGSATFSKSGLSAGIYSVVIIYGGSPACQGSTSEAVTLVAH